ncbi:hypothetical protein [Fastidiosibacter lacustris]|uniref:hypothetical protein n=1 Tax=Fastidiosibacter lacustris TaxID=2056695 RepID=UPI000E352632|nr:hypothetical protein [Fastidiosibacter lacustris]
MALTNKITVSNTSNLPYAIVIGYMAIMIVVMTVIVSLSIKEAEKKSVREAALRASIDDHFAKTRAEFDKQFEQIRRDRGRWGG